MVFSLTGFFAKLAGSAPLRRIARPARRFLRSNLPVICPWLVIALWMVAAETSFSSRRTASCGARRLPLGLFRRVILPNCSAPAPLNVNPTAGLKVLIGLGMGRQGDVAADAQRVLGRHPGEDEVFELLGIELLFDFLVRPFGFLARAGPDRPLLLEFLGARCIAAEEDHRRAGGRRSPRCDPVQAERSCPAARRAAARPQAPARFGSICQPQSARYSWPSSTHT